MLSDKFDLLYCKMFYHCNVYVLVLNIFISYYNNHNN